MRQLPPMFFVARDLRDRTELFAGYDQLVVAAWAEPTNGHLPIAYDSRESAEEEDTEHLGAYVVEMRHVMPE